MEDKRTSKAFRETTSQRMKEYWARKRAAIARANVVPTTPNVVEIAKALPAEPNYKKLYHDAMTELKQVKAKNEQYEQLIKSYAENIQNTTNALKKATLEYDARIKFMLDCVRHCYTSMQLAAEATSEKGGK